MTREEIVAMFRGNNPKITTRVASNVKLHNWLLVGDKEIAAETRCIVDNGTTISTSEDDERFDLPANITRFYDINVFPDGGVAYNDKRLEQKTMAQLDEEDSGWRTRSSGTPESFYRQGKYIYLDRPIDSNAYDLTIYSILLPLDFDDDSKTPFSQLTFLEPFHYSLVLYLEKRAMQKVGKRQDVLKAEAEFNAYVAWMKKMLIGGRHTVIQFRPSANRYSTS